MKDNSKKVALVNMAFGVGSESKESQGFDKYVGIAPFFVKGVNMTMAEMKALYPDRNYEKEFDYNYNKEGEAKGTFVTFQLETNPDHKDSNGILLSTRASYLIKDEYVKTQKGEFQFINKYGDPVYMSEGDFKAKKLPDYAVKHGYIWDEVRPAYVGEVQLVDFLRTFINIPISRNWNAEERVLYPKTGEELAAAECGFSIDDIKKIIAGDVSVVKNAIKHQINNQIKFLVGVRTTADNKEYQEVCARMPIRFGVTDYKKVDADLQKIKDGGGLASSNYGVYPFSLQVYQVGMTDFSAGGSQGAGLAPQDDPFAGFGG